MSKTRMQYTKEFKLSAVKLITEQGYSYAEAGRSLMMVLAVKGNYRRTKKKFAGYGKKISSFAWSEKS